ncbi:MAG: hypothetical protein QF535_03510 [Anaerolineales bacterium]|nr:hypothetical protein [Anaerolineales bacterium]
MLNIIAVATTQSADAGTNIQITLPAVITFAGVCAFAFALIKIGDRLWGRGKNGSKNGDDKIIEGMGKLGETCTQSREKLVESTNSLAQAMTKYTELQQASLKIAEYQYDSITKQLEGLSTQANNTRSDNKEDIRAIHTRLDEIALGIRKKT